MSYSFMFLIKLKDIVMEIVPNVISIVAETVVAVNREFADIVYERLNEISLTQLLARALQTITSPQVYGR